MMHIQNRTSIFQHLLVYALYATLVSASLTRRTWSTAATASFDWSTIEPSENLIYHDCYQYDRVNDQTIFKAQGTEYSRTYKCACLLVPLDWQNASNPNRLAIAIIKLPAQKCEAIYEDGESYPDSPRCKPCGGTIFFNPGGPGGSGIDFLIRIGHDIQSLVEAEKQFDILSFDPRGVGVSTNANCFSDYLSDQIWELKERLIGELGTDTEALKMKIASAQGRAELCAMDKYNGSNDNLRAYMSTAYVARDMLEILRADQLSKRSSILTTMSNQDWKTGYIEDSNNLLNFIGLSYGTMLGNTFASLYPQHVGKMLLDGNLDADDWVSKWLTTSVVDFEDILSFFFEECYGAKNTCALWRSSDTSPTAIKQRVDCALAKIKERPIPISSLGSTDVITYAEVKLAIYSGFYRADAFAYLAAFLDAINQGNVSDHLPWLKMHISCPAGNLTAWPSKSSYDAMYATACGDAESLATTPLTGFEDYLGRLKLQSPTAGPLSAEWRLPCMVWPNVLRPKWRFGGPFGTTDNNNTQTPILFVNNRLDPVTPIQNAHTMSRRYPGSVVLEQDAVGHCALDAALGDCVRDHVRRYFNTGILPARGTLCPGGCQPFGSVCKAGNWAAL